MLWMLNLQNITLCLLVYRIILSNPGCSIGAFRFTFHDSWMLKWSPAGGGSRLFDLQHGHPRALPTRQDRISQQGVREDAEHWAGTRRQDEGVHASAHRYGLAFWTWRSNQDGRRPRGCTVQYQKRERACIQDQAAPLINKIKGGRADLLGWNDICILVGTEHPCARLMRYYYQSYGWEDP